MFLCKFDNTSRIASTYETISPPIERRSGSLEYAQSSTIAIPIQKSCSRHISVSYVEPSPIATSSGQALNAIRPRRFENIWRNIFSTQVWADFSARVFGHRTLTCGAFDLFYKLMDSIDNMTRPARSITTEYLQQLLKNAAVFGVYQEVIEPGPELEVATICESADIDVNDVEPSSSVEILGEAEGLDAIEISDSASDSDSEGPLTPPLSPTHFKLASSTAVTLRYGKISRIPMPAYVRNTWESEFLHFASQLLESRQKHNTMQVYESLYGYSLAIRLNGEPAELTMAMVDGEAFDLLMKEADVVVRFDSEKTWEMKSLCVDSWAENPKGERKLTHSSPAAAGWVAPVTNSEVSACLGVTKNIGYPAFDSPSSDNFSDLGDGTTEYSQRSSNSTVVFEDEISYDDDEESGIILDFNCISPLSSYPDAGENSNPSLPLPFSTLSAPLETSVTEGYCTLARWQAF